MKLKLLLIVSSILQTSALFADSILFTREGNEIWRYSATGAEKVGHVPSGTFKIFSSGGVLYTQENNELWRYDDNGALKVGSLSLQTTVDFALSEVGCN